MAAREDAKRSPKAILTQGTRRAIATTQPERNTTQTQAKVLRVMSLTTKHTRSADSAQAGSHPHVLSLTGLQDLQDRQIMAKF